MNLQFREQIYNNHLKELISDSTDEQYGMAVENKSSEEQVKRRGPIHHVKDHLIQIFHHAQSNEMNLQTIE
jgi:hypothetical protein